MRSTKYEIVVFFCEDGYEYFDCTAGYESLEATRSLAQVEAARARKILGSNFLRAVVRTTTITEALIDDDDREEPESEPHYDPEEPDSEPCLIPWWGARP